MKKIMSHVQRIRTAPWLNSGPVILVAYAAATLVILSPVLIFGYSSFLVNLDNVDQYFSWYQRFAIDFHSGFLPMWNPNVYGGWSFVGEIQQGIFYPLNILWIWLFGGSEGISRLALEWFIALHFFIAAIGYYLVALQFGARKWAAWMGGIIFAFSGAVAFRSVSQISIFFGLCLLPYPLYFYTKFRSDQRRRWLAATGVMLGLVLLAGHIQPLFHASLLLFGYEFIRLIRNHTSFTQYRNETWRSIKHFALVGVTALVVMSPQLWVSASYLPDTYRVNNNGYAGPGEKINYAGFSSTYNLGIHEVFNLWDPVSYSVKDGNNFFIGLVPLSVLVLGVTLGRNRFKKTALWQQNNTYLLAVLLFAAAAMIGCATWFAVLLYKLPVVYQIRQLGRYAIMIDFALILIFVAAAEAMVRQRFTKKQRLILALVAGFFAVNAVYLYLLRIHIFSLHHALQTSLLAAVLLTFAVVRSQKLRQAALIGLVLLTALVNTRWYLPKITDDMRVTEDYKISETLVERLEETSGEYRVQINNDVLPVNIGNAYNFQTMGGYSATIYAPFYQLVHIQLQHRELMTDLFGVRYFVDKEVPTGRQQVYKDTGSGLYIWERETALPKAFTAPNGSTKRDEYKPVEVKTLTYNGRTQRYEVTLSSAQRVVFNEQTYPGWVARVDGQPVNLYQHVVDETPIFKAIDLPAGTHTVEFQYKPFRFF